MSASIQAALKLLDPQNDNHWTDDGLPRVDTVKFFAKDATLTRDDITKAAPAFNRTVPLIESEGDDHGADEEASGHGGPDTDPQAEAVQGLEAELAEAQAALDASAARVAEAQKEHEARRKEVDRLAEALDKARPRTALGTDIRAYLNRQNDVLHERAVKRAKLASIGGMEALKALLPERAPVDAALKNRKRT